MSIETNQCIIQHAVSNCPSVAIGILGKQMPSLLDSGSMVTLVCEGYFQKNILPLLQGSSGNLAEAHSLFQLSGTNNGVIPVSKYFEADVTMLGFTIPWVGFLIVKDPNTLFEPQYTSQLLGVVVNAQLNFHRFLWTITTWDVYGLLKGLIIPCLSQASRHLQTSACSWIGIVW